MKSLLPCTLFLCLAVNASALIAGPDAFGPGPVIKDYGQIAPVPDAEAIPGGMDIKLSYDVRDGGEPGAVNSVFNSAAGLLNTLVASGVEQERVHLALVIHGTAYKDILTDEAYGGTNPNGPLVEQLLANGVKIYYCGQAAVYRDVTKADVIAGIQFSLSASAAHAVLQMQGYGVRPY